MTCHWNIDHLSAAPFPEIHTVRLQNHWMHFSIGTFLLLTFVLVLCLKIEGYGH